MAKPIHISKVQAEDRIVQLLQERNEEAVKLIFERYGNAMYNTIYRVLCNRAMSEDVLQEVLVKIWHKFDNYNARRGSLFTWLVSISRNAAIDKTRGKEFIQSRKSADLDQLVYSEGTVAIKASKSQEQSEGVRETVDLLPEPEATLVRMAFFEGFTHVDIAKELDMPLGTVKTKIRSAIKKLRNLF